MTGLINLLKQGLVIYGAVKPAMNKYYLVLLGLALGMLVGIIVVPIYFRPNAEPVKMDEIYRDQWIKDTANGYQYVTDFADSSGLSDEDATLLRQSAEQEVKNKLTDVGATTADIDGILADNTSSTYLVQSLGAIRPFAEEIEPAATEQKENAEIPGSFARILTTLGIFILFGIFGAIITLVFKLFDIPFLGAIMNLINPKEEDPALAAAKARKAARQQAADLKTSFDTPPVAQFMSTYLAGDNYYDDSFAVELDDENKTFLGECGSGISEHVSVEGQKKVVATEVWIFDKTDGSTITKVLVSEEAYKDEELRAKLAPRGDVIVAQIGERFSFETQMLRMQATVVSLENNSDDVQYFEKVTVELAVWQKEGADVGGDDDGLPKPLIDVDAYLAQQEAAKAPTPAPVGPPPTQQQTQPMPSGPPPTGPSRPIMPPQQRPPMPQQGPPPQQRPPMPQQGPPPQQRPPMPQQGPPPQQRPPMPQQGPPPQQRPPMPQQGPPPQQRPPMPQQGQNRPPMPQQGGPRPQIPPQQQSQRLPQQGQNRPPMPPQQGQGDSPFGDTGDFNLQ